MKTSVFEVFVNSFVFVVVFAVGAVFHAPLATAELKPITHCGGELEPIKDSGSYALLNNITSPGPGDCLQVTADFVTIDLGGFLITGPGVSVGSTGIAAKGKNIVVRNGIVTRFSLGLAIVNGSSIVEGVRSFGNNVGIFARGSGILRNSIVQDNANLGILAGPSMTVSGNIVQGNEAGGISTAASSTVDGNTVIGNFGDGIKAGSGSTVSNNTIQKNHGFGIFITPEDEEGTEMGSGSIVSGNTVRRNDKGGIIVGFGNLVSSNVVQNNSPAEGIAIETGSTVINNIAEGNSLNLVCGIGANIIHNTVTTPPDGVLFVVGNCILHENVGTVVPR